ncbi:MAG: hypothetical protein IJ252_01660 [Solobacterium sp.]|nr:hypothetical protein [Solobacterium sp.]
MKNAGRVLSAGILKYQSDSTPTSVDSRTDLLRTPTICQRPDRQFGGSAFTGSQVPAGSFRYRRIRASIMGCILALIQLYFNRNEAVYEAVTESFSVFLKVFYITSFFSLITEKKPPERFLRYAY